LSPEPQVLELEIVTLPDEREPQDAPYVDSTHMRIGVRNCRRIHGADELEEALDGSAAEWVCYAREEGLAAIDGERKNNWLHP
jgi:hypothetical protein